MSDRYKVVQSRVGKDGLATHLVMGPGGMIEVDDDGGGRIIARLREGYVLGEESEADVLFEAERATISLGKEEGRSDVTGE